MVFVFVLSVVVLGVCRRSQHRSSWCLSSLQEQSFLEQRCVQFFVGVVAFGVAVPGDRFWCIVGTVDVILAFWRFCCTVSDTPC